MTIPRGRWRAWIGLAVSALMALPACAVSFRKDSDTSQVLRETTNLIDEVKAFGQSIGIRPTDALSRTAEEGASLSMLWLWLQKAGTLALDRSVDIRMAVGLSSLKERTKIEQVYKVDGYSVYFRQGNEFADSRSAVTPSFASQGIVRRVSVILHEDLHGDANFDLPWDIEEAVVTPLSALAAAEFFKRKGETANLRRAEAALSEGRQISGELHLLARRAQTIFQSAPVDEAKQSILALLSDYPAYHRMFRRQIVGQHPSTVLEAKLSHDFAYFRYFEIIVKLAEALADIKLLLAELKGLPAGITPQQADDFFRLLTSKYSPSQSQN